MGSETEDRRGVFVILVVAMVQMRGKACAIDKSQGLAGVGVQSSKALENAADIARFRETPSEPAANCGSMDGPPLSNRIAQPVRIVRTGVCAPSVSHHASQRRQNEIHTEVIGNRAYRSPSASSMVSTRTTFCMHTAFARWNIY